MASYSWVAGMELRGLNWVFVPITQQSVVQTRINGNAYGLSGLLTSKVSFGTTADPSTTPGGAGVDIVILENYLINTGGGNYVNCLFVYDMNHPGRLPGDGIRFHASGQFLPAKPL